MLIQRSATKNFNNECLLTFFSYLPPTGPRGFEGLIRDLLEAWCGETFRLARTGSQHGKDATSSDDSSNVIAAEMKRYDGKTSLTDRSIAGELVQVLEHLPDLDIWVLASAKELGETEVRNLHRRGQEHGIEVVVLDAREVGIGPLQAFLAEFPEIVLAFCHETVPSLKIQVQQDLSAICSHPAFPLQSSLLRKTLQRATIGFDVTREQAKKWFFEKIQNPHESMATFFQDVALCDANRPIPIIRKQIFTDLSAWWKDGDSQGWKCALLGEEGTGKTWAVMSWLLELSTSPSSPIIIPIMSGQLSPHSDDLGELISRIFSKRFGRSEVFWKRRFNKWNFKRTEVPKILIVFDGLNEAPRVQWRSLLDQFSGEDWKNGVALLTTCRPHYWKQLYASGHLLLATEGYDDSELEQVLQRVGRRTDDIPQALRPLIRKPRYCELVLQHFESMTADPTVERLLYEDYRNRISKKSKFPVTSDAFREILASLAEKYRKGTTFIRRHDISKYFMGESNADAAIQEIIDGGLLVETGQNTSPLRVDRRRLIHGLGMLLADHLKDGNHDIAVHKGMIDAWLEPGQEMEIKGAVVGAAIFFAVIDLSYPSNARQALMENWLCRRNLPDDEEDILTAYFPEFPNDVLALADTLWAEKAHNEVAEERLIWGILHRRDHLKVKPALVMAVKRWMSFINIGGYPSGQNHSELRNKALVAIQERLGRSIQADDDISLGRWIFKAIDDDRKFFLSHLALKVIGAGDRLSFVDALTHWAISRAILDRHYEADDVAWVLRLTDESLWDVLKSEWVLLAKSESEIQRKAANILLWCMGSRESNGIRMELLQDLYQKPDWVIENEKDPCVGIFALARDRYQECINRDDLPIKGVIRKLNEYLPDPELRAHQGFIDRLLEESRNLQLQGFCHNRMGKTVEECEIDGFLDVAARFHPTLAGQILRAIVQELPNRSEEQQSDFLWYLPKISMLLSREELPAVRKALSLIRSTIVNNNIDRNGKYSEADSTIALLYHLRSDEVIDEILGRPNEAFDNIKLFELFQGVAAEKGQYLLDQLMLVSDKIRLQRVLWLLPAVPPDIVHKEHENRLVELLLGEDADLCCGAIRYAYFSGNETLMGAVIRNSTCLLSNSSSRVNVYGAAILRRRAADFSFEWLIERLSLPDIIRAVSIRGCAPEEIDLLARILSVVILPTNNVLSDAGEALVAKVAQRERHSLRTLLVAPEVMAAILERSPDLVRAWIALALGGSSSVLHINAGFYYSLCGVLLKNDSEDGIHLWQRIDSIRGSRLTSSGIDWLVLVAFGALPQKAGIKMCEGLVLNALSDVELYRIVLAARQYEQEQWVVKTAERLLRSHHLWQRGKGLMLIALSDHYSKCFGEAVKEAEVSGTWLETPSKSMQDIFDRNQWGKYWYLKFLTAGEEDEAYSAWRLFLSCIDGRSQAWMEIYENENCLAGTKAAKRLQFRDMNDSQVTHAIEDREKEYTDHFLTIKMGSFERDRVLPYYTNDERTHEGGALTCDSSGTIPVRPHDHTH